MLFKLLIIYVDIFSWWMQWVIAVEQNSVVKNTLMVKLIVIQVS